MTTETELLAMADDTGAAAAAVEHSKGVGCLLRLLSMRQAQVERLCGVVEMLLDTCQGDIHVLRERTNTHRHQWHVHGGHSVIVRRLQGAIAEDSYLRGLVWPDTVEKPQAP